MSKRVSDDLLRTILDLPNLDRNQLDKSMASEILALRQLVRDVMAMPPVWFGMSVDYHELTTFLKMFNDHEWAVEDVDEWHWICPYCGEAAKELGDIEHRFDCLVTIGRALVARLDTAESPS